MTDFKVGNDYEFGKRETTKLFANVLKNEASIEDVKLQSHAPDEPVAVTTNKYSWNIPVPSGYFVDFSDSYFIFDHTFTVTDSGTAVGVGTANKNIAPVYARFAESELLFNGTRVQRMNNIPKIRRLISYFTHSKNALKENDFYLHYDDPTDSLNQCQDQRYSSGRFVNLVGSSATDIDGKTMTFTSDGTNMAITTDVANTKTAVVTMESLATDPYYTSKNKTGARRKKEILDDATAANCRYSYKVPFSYFFSCLDDIGKFKYLPIGKVEVHLTKGATTDFGIYTAGVPYITDNAITLHMAYTKFNPIALQPYIEHVKKGTPIVIPYMRYDYATTSVEAGANGKTVSRNSYHAGLLYVLNYFNLSSNTDPYSYQHPVKYSTALNNGTVTKRFKFDSKDLFESSRDIVYNGSQKDAGIMYDEYLEIARLMGNREELAISYQDMIQYRPVYCTKVNKKPAMLPSNQSPPLSNRIDEEFRISGTVVNNTVMNSVYVKQSYIIYNPADKSLKAINMQ